MVHYPVPNARCPFDHTVGSRGKETNHWHPSTRLWCVALADVSDSKSPVPGPGPGPVAITRYRTSRQATKSFGFAWLLLFSSCTPSAKPFCALDYSIQQHLWISGKPFPFHLNAQSSIHLRICSLLALAVCLRCHPGMVLSQRRLRSVAGKAPKPPVSDEAPCFIINAKSHLSNTSRPIPC